MAQAERARGPIAATDLSQFIRLENCERYLRFRLLPDEVRALLARFELTEQPLTPLLQASGAEFEQQLEAAIGARYQMHTFAEGADPSETVAVLAGVQGQLAVLAQAPVVGQLHGWPCAGVADLVWAVRQRNGTLRLAIADIKASRKDRVEHRLQVAFYGALLQQMLTASGELVDQLRGAVLRVPDAGGLPDIEALHTYAFDLQPYLLALEHLLAPDGVVARVMTGTLAEARYHLSPKCDGCLYNALCMVESAEREDLALLSELTPSAKQLLHTEGIYTISELATLALPDEAEATEPPAAPPNAPRFSALASNWQVGPQLPYLVQRARMLQRRLRPVGSGPQVPSFLRGRGFPRLPGGEGLVKVFLDAQHDYLEDRLYLIGSLVEGPAGRFERVSITPGPPRTPDAERTLLLGLVEELVRSIPAAAGQVEAPLHFYLYDRHDQKVLLQALRRHLHDLSGVTVLFDLLTEHEALDQPMVSFLADEVRTQRNLPATCLSLYTAAGNSWAGPEGGRTRFDWDGDRGFLRRFWARIFDNRRAMVRAETLLAGPSASGGPSLPALRPAPAESRTGVIWVESASRFNSQLPLEYIYGAWGELPDPNTRWRQAGWAERRALLAFRGVTVDDVTAFEGQRLRALAHIEASFPHKNERLRKRPLRLAALAESALAPVPLSRTLEEFICLEHHASLQEKLTHFALLPAQRAATGRSLMVRCIAVQGDGAQMVIDFPAAGLDAALAMHAVRLKEGDWVVMTSAAPVNDPWRVVRGRLAMIERLDSEGLWVAWRDFPSRGNRFRYTHERIHPEPGAHYMLDEMPDDLNADKVVAACRQAAGNSFYQWIEVGQPPPPHPIPVAVRRQAVACLRGVQRVEAPRGPTQAQSAVIGQHLADPILLVQGPPGTGKSHTLGWAVLVRIMARMAAGQPVRVAVVCKTHPAVNIVLESIASKARRWLSAGGDDSPDSMLAGLEVYKVDAREHEVVPAGVTALPTYGPGNTVLETILARSPLVIGGTPGGLYNLMKRRKVGGREVAWDEKSFDLVVIDEASQMTLPEALLATAFLRPDGQVLVVGDHRQMPPILAHPWDEEERRHLASTQPYRSAFEYLRDLGVPTVALDESFRLHQLQAAFLAEQIYRHDGIDFHSRQQRLLQPQPKAGATDYHMPRHPYIEAVLRADIPIVVIEHSEQRSQQFNATEIALMVPVIEACLQDYGLDGGDGIGVVVPHRAQKAALCERFPALAQANGIDTVERFQGGERDVILVSATASDPDFVLAEASFLLDPKRLNVALSRPRRKLIVVASQTLFRLLSADLDVFEHATLWKRLRYSWATEQLWQGHHGPITVAVYGCGADIAHHTPRITAQ